MPSASAGGIAASRLVRRTGAHRRVPAGERVLHRMLGVGIFGWLLERSGWNRHVAGPVRGFDGDRRTRYYLNVGLGI